MLTPTINGFESERSEPPDAVLEVVGSVIMAVVVVGVGVVVVGVAVVAVVPVSVAIVEVVVEEGAAEVLESISVPI